MSDNGEKKARNMPDISSGKKVEYQVEPYLMYVNDAPVGIAAGTSEEQVVAGYRSANLGRVPETDVLRAVPTREAPFEDFMRKAMSGLYMQMVQSQMAAMARGPRRS